MLIKRMLLELLDRLWANYSGRVEYARRYGELVAARGGRVVHDHIAFRTLNTRTGQQPPGIEAIARLVTPLGYEAAGSYEYHEKHVTARHYQHEDALLPKIFVSQLEVAELPRETGRLIDEAVADAHNLLDTDTQARLRFPEMMLEENQEGLVDRLFDYITKRPWSPPRRDAVIEISKVSRYAAWTLLHGNDVNHFAALINEQRVPEWPHIEATAEALRAAGIPMSKIEGEPGGRLRQVATQAIEEDSEVRELDGRLGKLRWRYAYYEVAERGLLPGPNGTMELFQGFLGAQAPAFSR